MVCGLPGQPCCLAATHMDVTGAKPYFGFKKRPRPIWRHSWKPAAPSHPPSETNSCSPHELWANTSPLVEDKFLWLHRSTKVFETSKVDLILDALNPRWNTASKTCLRQSRKIFLNAIQSFARDSQFHLCIFLLVCG